MIKVIYRQQNTQFGFHVCIFLNTIKYIALEEVQSISSMHSEYWPDVTCDNITRDPNKLDFNVCLI